MTDAEVAESRDRALSWAEEVVAQLRIRELQECLEKCSLRKSGRKNELAVRLLDALREARQYAGSGMDPNQHYENLLKHLRNAYLQLHADNARGPSHLLIMPQLVHPAAMARAAATIAANGAPPPPPQPQHPSHVMMHAPGRMVGVAGAAYAGAAMPQAPGAPPALPGRATIPGNTYAVSQALGRSAASGSGAGASGTAAGGGGGGGAGSSSQARAPVGSPATGRTIRCLCGSLQERPRMVQCAGCRVWQHGDCVAAPVAVAGRPPPEHWCEVCRVERADPFWKTEVQVLNPPGVKLAPTGKSSMVGTTLDPVAVAERSFTLPTQLHDQARRGKSTRVLLWCLQLNDPVPFRCHWPMGCDLRINNAQYRVYGRTPSAKLGANQRDDPASIAIMCHTGRLNQVRVQGVDSRQYAVVLQIATQRSVEDVKQLMKPPESLQQSIARVAKQMGGGGGGGGDNDEEDELMVTHALHSLRCPLSGVRIKTPARFVDVPGLACFDLDAFLSMVEKTKRWQCPHSMRNSSVHNLQVDTYTVKVLEGLARLPAVTEVELSPEGKWRPASASRPGAASTSAAADRPWYNAGDIPQAFIKPEPVNGVLSDSDEEEDEAEELRKAAAAVRGTANGGGGKRQAEPMVIDLMDSDDEAAPPPAKRPRAAAAAAPAAAAVAAGAATVAAAAATPRVVGAAGARTPGSGQGAPPPRLPFATGARLPAGGAPAGSPAATANANANANATPAAGAAAQKEGGAKAPAGGAAAAGGSGRAAGAGDGMSPPRAAAGAAAGAAPSGTSDAALLEWMLDAFGTNAADGAAEAAGGGAAAARPAPAPVPTAARTGSNALSNGSGRGANGGSGTPQQGTGTGPAAQGAGEAAAAGEAGAGPAGMGGSRLNPAASPIYKPPGVAAARQAQRQQQAGAGGGAGGGGGGGGSGGQTQRARPAAAKETIVIELD